MKNLITTRCFPAAILALCAGQALAGGNPWLDNGNAAASNNILGSLNNVPLNLTANGETLLKLEYTDSVFTGPPDVTYSTGSIVGGYWGNVANAGGCLVFGGHEFVVSGNPTITARPNLAQDFGGTIMGGADNATGDANDTDQFGQPFATVGGGFSNEARGAYSTVIGGLANEAKGYAATNIGGSQNAAGGNFSMAGGYNAVVRNADTVGDSDGDQGCFVWSDYSSTVTSFTTTGPNQFLIRAAGGVGIGTNSPDGQLEVSAAGTFQRPHFTINETTGNFSRLAFTNATTNKFWHFSAKCNGATPADDQLNYYYQDSNGQGRNPLQIRGDGRIGIGGPAPGTGITLDVFGTARCTTLIQTSSQRYKTDVESLPSVLDRFVQLRPVAFTWDKDHGGTKDVGLIAEEVAAVFPEAVATIDGQVEGINYSRVTALAIQAVKEQQQKAAASEARVNKLEAENAELKARLERIEKALTDRR